MCKAISVAGWFINNDFKPTNDKSGNLKLNKLLYFAQMISLIKRNKPLFEEELYAFENGVVVEKIRKDYCNNYDDFVKLAKEYDKNFNEDEIDILESTKELFLNVSPEDLSELTHQHKCWKHYYNKSIEEAKGYKYNKESARMPIGVIKNVYKDDLLLIKKMVDALEISYDIKEEKIVINNTEFYYNPEELCINEAIKQQLEEFPSYDEAYSLYIDEEQGLVVY
ncbi:SocA family protein (endogenous virus) [Clostridium phage phiCTC2B]|uniref:Antitoxin SocA-like Panacea domain-containing protein n=1 Tax=Clostridium tetani (strain Massachusetts / E88) TaxID=212717 RepID=Q892I9_CLOTE|nr:Panacea domain-containing protein [Clostridium tetani]YP_009276959.1 SocA family protein [Clostridium phage phiCT19406B]YP_009277403.1 SocA family protein [Clostridium phage phiCTC2B]AAO36606.1 hypothetical protein CTC_02108 [Clostridium tetani E88]AJA42819.1 hypothetical protein phiCT19406B_62 [Clostridium phage phiCT19406B]AJA43015.1 hypothetical protein phiCTC2B_62 [Clostridium phage phiCTC2B]KGI39090.1 hypothetical protein KY52_04655 [Clostridium tetani]KGI43659.1 hypothetical protein